MGEQAALRKKIVKLRTLSALAQPAHLVVPARRLLEDARQLLAELRSLSRRLARLSSHLRHLTLTAQYCETVALLELALQIVQSLPQEPVAQVTRCHALASLLQVIARKESALQARLADEETVCRRVDELATRLRKLARGETESWRAFLALAENIWNEARESCPLRNYLAGQLAGDRYAVAGLEPARVIACHALQVAQVTARLLRYDAEWSARPREAIAAALVLDVGLLTVDSAAWLHDSPLSADQRRLVEGHVAAGVAIVERLAPGLTWLRGAVAGHHERLDGTGYPGGLHGQQVPSLARLLATADVYAALTEPRVHRAALDPRSALADTLLQAENGLLDREQAERLLHFSFYPTGTAVELTDGATGIVVATHMGRRDRQTPARPVIMLLTRADGSTPAVPEHLDLNDCEGRSILRSLNATETHHALARRP